MSKCPNSLEVSYTVFDNGKEVIIFCNQCQKKLDTYRKLRYHFAVIHGLDESQYKRASKAGRFLR